MHSETVFKKIRDHLPRHPLTTGNYFALSARPPHTHIQETVGSVGRTFGCRGPEGLLL